MVAAAPFLEQLLVQAVKVSATWKASLEVAVGAGIIRLDEKEEKIHISTEASVALMRCIVPELRSLCILVDEWEAEMLRQKNLLDSVQEDGKVN